MEAQETDRHELIAGKYRVTRLIGRGGMGTVWEGVHASLGTRVAIKFIDAEHTQNTDLRSRFANEAQAAARLRTKHVVQVFDFGRFGGGHPGLRDHHNLGRGQGPELRDGGRGARLIEGVPRGLPVKGPVKMKTQIQTQI